MIRRSSTAPLAGSNYHRTLAAAAVVCAAKDEMDGVKVAAQQAMHAWREHWRQQVAHSARSMAIRAHSGFARSCRVSLDAVSFSEDRD
jgi:hypothetical protein